MTTHVVTAHNCVNHKPVRINRGDIPPMPYADAVELMLMLARSMPWLHKHGCHAYLSVEPVSRWVR